MLNNKMRIEDKIFIAAMLKVAAFSCEFWLLDHIPSVSFAPVFELCTMIVSTFFAGAAIDPGVRTRRLRAMDMISVVYSLTALGLSVANESSIYLINAAVFDQRRILDEVHFICALASVGVALVLMTRVLTHGLGAFSMNATTPILGFSAAQYAAPLLAAGTPGRFPLMRVTNTLDWAMLLCQHISLFVGGTLDAGGIATGMALLSTAIAVWSLDLRPWAITILDFIPVFLLAAFDVVSALILATCRKTDIEPTYVPPMMGVQRCRIRGSTRKRVRSTD